MSMNIKVDRLGKRFQREWIVRRFSYEFSAGQIYAVHGPNGSGKSTLLKMLSSHLSPSKGKISFFQAQKAIPVAEVYSHLAYAAPYIELIEELTLDEAIHFHLRFKNLLDGLSANDLIKILGFESSQHKQIRFFSSGMKQRLKLALAICSDTSLLLLDEPTTNFDKQGIQWYRQLLQKYTRDRIVIIASNIALDFDFAQHEIHILDYK
ncbi:MAG: ABC transporter ATP-binding protein [Saprospiraceae bacterium]|nr:ABC transporter ATP-binding protein [Saprospiraceae bacterium]